MRKFCFLLLAGLALAGCSTAPARLTFAQDAPQREAVSPFPLDRLYSSSPDPGVIVGSGLGALTGFELSSGKQLWIVRGARAVGGTSDHVVAFYDTPSRVEFLDPRSGEVRRAVAPAPRALTSKGQLELGMAFSDRLYLTTRAVHSSIWDGGSDDRSFAIGLTAKEWGKPAALWFAPPLRQIERIAHRPRIVGDKVLVLGAKETPRGPQQAQLLSLSTGKELSRLETAGEFLDSRAALIERAPTHVRALDPSSGKESWKIQGDFTTSDVFEIAGQLTVVTPQADGSRQALLVSIVSGKELAKQRLPDLTDVSFRGCYLSADKTLLLHVGPDPFVDIEGREPDYWVALDSASGAPLWRTNKEAAGSLSSLLPLAGQFIKFPPL